MKARGEVKPHWYISGPHPRDYYLLLDEQSDHLFAMRLAAHVREAPAGLATALPEIWIDDTEKQVWYLFQAGPLVSADT
jgi:hypothetical protein